MNYLVTIMLFFTLLFTGCNMSDAYIKAHSWKNCGDYNKDLGDWVEFTNTNYVLQNDTIFSGGIPVVKIINRKKSYSGNKIILESFSTKVKCIYCEK